MKLMVTTHSGIRLVTYDGEVIKIPLNSFVSFDYMEYGKSILTLMNSRGDPFKLMISMCMFQDVHNTVADFRTALLKHAEHVKDHANFRFIALQGKKNYSEDESDEYVKEEWEWCRDSNRKASHPRHPSHPSRV
jgi:hypothetical protein